MAECLYAGGQAVTVTARADEWVRYETHSRAAAWDVIGLVARTRSAPLSPSIRPSPADRPVDGLPLRTGLTAPASVVHGRQRWGLKSVETAQHEPLRCSPST